MKIHIFPFSPRKGTPAADLPDQVPPPIRRERVQRLTALERELARRYYESLIPQEVEVLVEQHSPGRPGWVLGHDRRYVPVEIPGSESDLGTIVLGRAERTSGQFLQASRRPNDAVAG